MQALGEIFKGKFCFLGKIIAVDFHAFQFYAVFLLARITKETACNKKRCKKGSHKDIRGFEPFSFSSVIGKITHDIILLLQAFVYL